MLCPGCGNDIPDISQFCLHCGKVLKPPEPKKVAAKVLVIAVALAIVVTVAGAFLVRHLEKNKLSSAPLSAPQPQAVTAEPQATAQPQMTAPPVPRELSDEEIFRSASPSVVLIEVFDEQGGKIGLGSGFVAAPNGTIVTNYHVIRGAATARVRFADSGTSTVDGVLGYDASRDVAVLRASDVTAKPLVLGDSDKVAVGNKVVAIGSPLGLQNTVSNGLVSGIRNAVIQTSAPISPGSSGGPFLNTSGEVIGIAVAAVLTGAENLNFVVPINWVKPLLGHTHVSSLAEIVQSNTVVQEVFGASVSIPAHQFMTRPFTVDRNRMSVPQLDGSFTSSGGLGGNIRVFVQQNDRIVYDSGRSTSGNVHLKLQPGTYQLVFDNRGSAMFPRTVSGAFTLRYVQ